LKRLTAMVYSSGLQPGSKAAEADHASVTAWLPAPVTLSLQSAPILQYRQGGGLSLQVH